MCRESGTYGRQERSTKILVGRPEERDHLGDLNVYGRILLKWIFKKWNGAWTRLIWLRIGTDGLNVVMNLRVL